MQPPNEQQSFNVSTPPSTPGTYVGNQTDLTSFLAMVAGVGVVISSCTGIGGCLLPIFALVAGIIGLRNSNQALNPSRVRTHAWIAIITGGIILLFIIAIIAFYGAIILAAITEAGRQAR